MGIDRLDYANRGVTDLTDLSLPAQNFLDDLRSEIDVPIRWIGTGFGVRDAVSVATRPGELIHA